MPFLDIATAQPSFQSHLYTVRFQTIYRSSFVVGNERNKMGFKWRYFRIPYRGNNFNVDKFEVSRPGLMIKAVATLEEPRCSVQGSHVKLGLGSSSLPEPQNQSSREESEELDEREKLRRLRISKANKGNTPWNKGRKHPPETLRRIKERTRIAMQDPKVKMKLANLGHAQSKETRIKIGEGVRIGWEKRREKLMLQETCHFQWQNLIAEASRRGFLGEEELQWDSYQILDEQLKEEWRLSVERRKNTPRPKGSKRAPKSAEQRKKISEAIAAKWADPVYRDRVYSGLTKYHGTIVGGEKPKRRPRTEGQPRKTSSTKKSNEDSPGEGFKRKNQTKIKRSNTPLYKDPLASSKLEMIKSIRAQRAAAESVKSEAITRAKLLIAEAVKAAEALEAAAMKSPLAKASLMETRKLIAEAVGSIQSIETENNITHDNSRSPSSEQVIHVQEELHVEEHEKLSQIDHIEVNGIKDLSLNDRDVMEFGFGRLSMQDLLDFKDDRSLEKKFSHPASLNGKEHIDLQAPNGLGLPLVEMGHLARHASVKSQLNDVETNGSIQCESVKPDQVQSLADEPSKKVSKRWVRGKLVEVAEEN